MKKILKIILIKVIYYSGFNWFMSKILRRKIFCVGYHSIYNEKNKDIFNHKLYPNISVNARKFEEQILFMKKSGHTFVHFSDLLKADIKFVNKPTVIFFDDGFKDVLVNALPILKKYNIPGTVFVTTGLIDRTHIMWTLGLRAFLYKRGVSSLAIEDKVIEFKKLKMKEREDKLSELYSGNNFVLDPGKFNTFLSWEEVKELSRNDVEIGSHGVSHQKFTELDDMTLEIELRDSKEKIKNILGLTVNTISYPYGRFDNRVEAMVKKVGYSSGVTTIAGYNDSNMFKITPFRIKRAKCPESDTSLLAFKVMLYMNI